MLGRMSTVQQPPAPPEPMSLEQRSAILAERLTWEARNGWRVTSQTQTQAQAQLAKGKPTSHLLHLVLTIIRVRQSHPDIGSGRAPRHDQAPSLA
jgi:hypothetical protein